MSSPEARPLAFIVSCEHGGNRIPARYRKQFAGHRALLETHRGYDAGALSIARVLAGALNAPLVFSTTSRLLVDLNRSPGHRGLHGPMLQALPPSERRDIVARYYQPYRDEVEARIRAAIARGRRVIHFSSHSFTPVFDGTVRNADLGLLYDPARAAERRLCVRLQQCLSTLVPSLRVRRNYPYTGIADGFIPWLRKRLPARAYVGVEFEFNQRLVGARDAIARDAARVLHEALRRALATDT